MDASAGDRHSNSVVKVVVHRGGLLLLRKPHNKKRKSCSRSVIMRAALLTKKGFLSSFLDTVNEFIFKVFYFLKSLKKRLPLLGQDNSFVESFPLDTSDEDHNKKRLRFHGGSGVMRATVLLSKKGSLSSAIDTVLDRIGKKVTFRLVSAVTADPGNGMKGKLGKPAKLEGWNSGVVDASTGDLAFHLSFDWEEEVGIPGAIIVRNNHHGEFYLKTITLDDIPGQENPIHFVCNSWVYPAGKSKDRIFFANKAYLPGQTPAPLVKYREEELVNLRGDGTGKLEEWDRIYDYAYYNDLSEPEKGEKYVRPLLGGSKQYPYPRRCRTGRSLCEEDPKMEKRIPLVKSLSIYIPRDEKFSQLKMSDVYAYAIKAVLHFGKPELEDHFDKAPGEFDSFKDVLKLYEGVVKLPKGNFVESILETIPYEFVKELIRSDNGVVTLPKPQVVEEDPSAWNTDEEFARQLLAGVNPNVICRLQEFPPGSKLNPRNNPEIMDHIRCCLSERTLDEAIENNKVFILDHYEALKPFLRKINETTTKTYATRTLLYLQKDGTLKALAIELILPHPKGDEFGEISEVYTPSKSGIGATLWMLAKAYVSVNDSGYHQLVGHWLKTHAVMEPFAIASHRQLSVLHPIHKLLHPHFRDTLNINALSRQTLINANGLLEMTVFPGRYSLELTSVAYRKWSLPEQALPVDLIKRGMAVEDPTARHGIRLLIEDYPFAVDGLEIWSAIRTWVQDYCLYYYKNDEDVKRDKELRLWWEEIRNVGHGDLKHEPWWPRLETVDELVQTCTIMIWVASALHAAINFGQYPYGGYMPNRPAMSRRFLPKEGTEDYEELRHNPEKAFLKTVTSHWQTVLGVTLIEVLSNHTSDEVYLGQAETPEWTSDGVVLEAFRRFGRRLKEIEGRIEMMNADPGRWKNRVGPVKMPYTLLYPSSDVGLTGRGIPNSVSI